MIYKDEMYSNKIFLNSVLPLFKVLVEEKEDLKKSFRNKNGVIQICCLDENKKIGIHFVVEEGNIEVVKTILENPDLELQFESIYEFNNFCKGKSKKLPKIKGGFKSRLLIPTIKALSVLSKMLSFTDMPNDEKEKDLLVKLHFYLISSGISQLNKADHPEITKWTQKSPDRAYEWRVVGKPELSAYIRIKYGKSKAGRGQYKRTKPFLAMNFNNTDSALDILKDSENLIKDIVNSHIIMEGATEYDAQIKSFMFLVKNLLSKDRKYENLFFE
ncbi:hypothetical protein [Clostridium sp. Marseille-Q7071]